MKTLIGFIRARPALSRLALRCIPDLRWTTSVEPIGRFRIRLRQHRTYWLRDPFTHDGTMLGGLRRLTANRPGCAVYDIGANIGLYTRLLLTPRIGAGQVVSFEPMSANFSLLRDNVALAPPDQSPRANALRLALSDRDGTTLLQVDDMMSQSAALNEVTGGVAAEGRRQVGLPPKTESVDTRRLDTAVTEFHLPSPGVIKLDVEGAEMLVLSGAEQTLRTHRPALAVELHGVDKARQVVPALRAMGYHVYGWASTVPHRSEYREITDDVLEALRDTYDLHHVFASTDAGELRAPIEPFDVHGRGGGTAVAGPAA
jgi:FkbM family methyltransferase